MSEKNEAPAGERQPIDANDLEAMAKERPDEMFLKGSGVLKLLSGIRQLESELRSFRAAPAGDAAMPAVAYAYDDPDGAWFEGMPCKRFDGVPPGRAQNSEPLVRKADALAALAARDADIARLTAERDATKYALERVMSWIDNWSPNFTEDGEWSADEKLARDALSGGAL